MASSNDFVPDPYPLTPEEYAAAMAKAKATFSSADLQRFTEEEDGIPMEEVIATLEEIQRQKTREAS
ncbi:MAG: hypothetical protein FJ271_29180 [Planctomycetes bacterium]|nr:hypothetical protein [Planctomycetota bacterium]